MSRVLVTGGAGFLGTHLVERLLLEGNEVICLDNFETGTRQGLLHLRQHPFLEIWRHDVCQPVHCQVDQIYHLACPASPAYYQLHPVKTIETCTIGTRHILQLASQTGARLVFVSTSEVYGDPTNHPQQESDWGHVNPVGPRSSYDEGKRAAEAMIRAYWQEYQVDVRTARLFNCYGPGMRVDDGRVISNFMVQALKDEPLTIYGTGQQTRSFCYIKDVVEALLRLMAIPLNQQAGDKPPWMGPVNIGNPDEIDIITLAQRIMTVTKSSSQLVHKSFPQDDPRKRCPDITRAKNLLNWQPSVSLDEGLDWTAEWYRQNLTPAVEQEAEFRLYQDDVVQPPD